MNHCTIQEAANSSTVLQAALAYLEAGVSVLPVKGKQPAIKWSQFQLQAPAYSYVHNWHRHGLLAGVGVITGKVSNNLVVIDLDGDEAVAIFHKHFSFNTLIVESGSRHGEHIYLRVEDLPPTTRTKGFELRSDGCYVVAPPSLHPATGSAYRVINNVPVMKLPHLQEVQQFIRQKIQPPVQQVVSRPANGFGRAALAGELEKLHSALAGERNNQLNRSAFKLGQLVAAGVLSRAAVEQALAAAGIAAGLSEYETKHTIRSGIEAGMKYPRSITIRRMA